MIAQMNTDLAALGGAEEIDAALEEATEALQRRI